ncbi:MAG: RnfABCDGE type electron transport complex subunit D, partial [Wenzhouxiangellaceae bacterium]
MKLTVAGAPHLPPMNSVAGMMRQVLYALIPGVLAHVWFFGWGVVVQIVVATIAALGFEWLSLRWRDRPVGVYLTDLS